MVLVTLFARGGPPPFPMAPAIMTSHIRERRQATHHLSAMINRQQRGTGHPLAVFVDLVPVYRLLLLVPARNVYRFCHRGKDWR
jgi:hypothetical protein